METILLIFGSAIIGFVFGALFYRNNIKKSEAVVKNLQDKIDALMAEVKK